MKWQSSFDDRGRHFLHDNWEVFGLLELDYRKQHYYRKRHHCRQFSVDPHKSTPTLFPITPIRFNNILVTNFRNINDIVG